MKENKMPWKNPDYLVVSGSNLYGYATPSSDFDKLGWVANSLEAELSIINRFKQKVPSETDLKNGNDTKICSLRKFIDHLCKNDTQCLEILYAPELNIEECTYKGQQLINNKRLFLSKQLYKRFAGYAFSEFRKIKGTAIIHQKRTVDEKTLLDQIRNLYKPDKKDMAHIIEVLEKNKPKKEVSVFRELGKQRKESIEKYGYSVKNAAHCIRLLTEGAEILETGDLKFPFDAKTRELLLSIRYGKLPFEEIEQLFEEKNKELKKALDKSELPDKIDMVKINKLYLDLMLN